MSASELKSIMVDPSKRAAVDYLIVDVRRADMDVSLLIFFDSPVVYAVAETLRYGLYRNRRER